MASAQARRGRGETDATEGHSLEDESKDVVAVIQSIDEPVFLLGHSYGAQAALAAAAKVPDRVRKLVLYEAAWPRVVGEEAMARLEELALAGDWDGFALKRPKKFPTCRSRTPKPAEARPRFRAARA